LIAAVLVAASVGACAGVGAGSVSVLVVWSGDTKDAFQAVLDEFTKTKGIKVNLTGTRALSQVLASDVQKGSPPDIAVLPSLGELAGYARRGALQPLDGVIDQSKADPRSQQWLELEKAGTDHRYAVVVAASLKSLIWYDPKELPNFRSQPPRTWDQLVTLSKALADTGRTPWCMGMGSTPTSGWPGTDWIEDILLHQSGDVDAYRRWTHGDKDWSKGEVRQAWTSWGTIAVGPGMVHGGPGAALLTDFGDAGSPMFTDPPGCLLHHQASFAPKPGTDVDFIPFPDVHTSDTDPANRRWEVSADFAGMFNDTPQARALIRYLASDKAQRIWPKRSNGTVFSVNKNVATSDVYRSDVSKRIEGILTGGDTLCYDASDLMPPAMTNAFYRAVLEYLHNPSRLDALLAQLDQVRGAAKHEDWLNVPCVRVTVTWRRQTGGAGAGQ
jgi:alpha-glucoside transport system substrate-binding protein